MNILKQNKKGFTLIELMISMFIGIVIFGGVFATFRNQKLLYSRQEKIIKIGQDTRAALNIMKGYIKRAGISIANCSFTDDNNKCTGLEAISTDSYFTITSDNNLNGAINPPSQIASDMERVTFIKGGDNSLYICANNKPSNNPKINSKCQFILDNIKEFKIEACYTDPIAGGTVCSSAPADKDKIDSIQITLQAETKENEITENNTKLEGSEIVARVFFINKTFQ